MRSWSVTAAETGDGIARARTLSSLPIIACYEPRPARTHRRRTRSVDPLSARRDRARPLPAIAASGNRYAPSLRSWSRHLRRQRHRPSVMLSCRHGPGARGRGGGGPGQVDRAISYNDSGLTTIVFQRQVVPMDSKSRDVLDAADRWLAAADALAGREGQDDGSEECELDEAESGLVDAVKAWRVAGRPS